MSDENLDPLDALAASDPNPDPLDALAASDPNLGDRDVEEVVLDFAQQIGATPDATGNQLLRAIAGASVISARRLGRIEELLDPRTRGDL